MWESAKFMFFSTLEVFSWCALSLSLFRYKVKDYAWQALFIIILMNLQSYILRNELSLAFLAPLINIVCFTLLYKTVTKIPLVGSLVVTISGFLVFSIIQTVLLLMYFGSISAVQTDPNKGQLLQTMTAVVVTLLSWVLFKFGYGFSYSFEKIRFKFEDIAVVIVILAFMTGVTVILYLNQAWLNMLFFCVSLSYFLYYAIRKEKEM